MRAAARAGRKDVLDVLMRTLGCQPGSMLIHDLATSPMASDARALSCLLLCMAPLKDVCYFAKVSFVLACLHGCDSVVKELVPVLHSIGVLRPRCGDLRLLEGLEEQEWREVAGLVANESVEVLDVGLAMALCGGHQRTARLVKRVQGGHGRNV